MEETITLKCGCKIRVLLMYDVIKEDLYIDHKKTLMDMCPLHDRVDNLSEVGKRALVRCCNFCVEMNARDQKFLIATQEVLKQEQRDESTKRNRRRTRERILF